MVDLVLRTRDAIGVFERTTPEYWPNWPMMNTICVQSVSLLDTTRHEELADKDLVIFQEFYPTLGRLTTRVAAIAELRALNPTSS